MKQLKAFFQACFSQTHIAKAVTTDREVKWWNLILFLTQEQRYTSEILFQGSQNKVCCGVFMCNLRNPPEQVNHSQCLHIFCYVSSNFENIKDTRTKSRHANFLYTHKVRTASVSVCVCAMKKLIDPSKCNLCWLRVCKRTDARGANLTEHRTTVYFKCWAAP